MKITGKNDQEDQVPAVNCSAGGKGSWAALLVVPPCTRASRGAAGSVLQPSPWPLDYARVANHTSGKPESWADREDWSSEL